GAYGTQGTPPQGPARRRLTAILAAVVALALVATGTLVWLFVIKDDGGGGGSGPLGGSAMKHAWNSPTAGARVDMLGAWSTGQRVYAGDKDAIVAYDVADGRETGKFTPPSGELCGMASTVSDGIGVAMYGPADQCDTTVAVELATMKPLWDKKTRNTSSTDDFLTVATAVDGGMVVLTTPTGLVAYDLKDGTQRWTAPSGATGSSSDQDTDDLRVEGGTVLTVATTYTKNTPAVITAFNSADGKRKWTVNIPASSDGYASAWLVHADPAVIEIERNGDYLLQSYDDSGRLRSEIPMRGPEGVLDAFNTRNPPYTSDFDSSTQYNVAIGNDTLYAMSTRRDQAPGEIVRLVAFDLSTGKARWSKPLGDELGSGVIVGSDPDGVLVLGSGLPGATGKLLAFRHEDGSSLGARDVDGKDLLGADDPGQWMLAEGRLVGFSWTARPDVPALVTLA
ncbi:MAG: PQQ-binding-like beta-propeller repeat protein, partial [Streptomycetaceae bacterium]|nr:PQQ-binding-like beta-propeller repeat protein [Streptomycetaceae bacterium]